MKKKYEVHTKDGRLWRARKSWKPECEDVISVLIVFAVGGMIAIHLILG